ncbi:MAG: hypothetical protein J6R00_04375, partial [Lentisphaeria bacterium]|nr:hypothetical protein [Lentisphaeria bacterium]
GMLQSADAVHAPKNGMLQSADAVRGKVAFYGEYSKGVYSLYTTAATQPQGARLPVMRRRGSNRAHNARHI